MKMLTFEQKQQFNEILEELGRTLDITEAQFNAAVKSYEAVGLHLAKHDSILGKYNPEILPQGSFMIGTMIKPIHEDDDLDVDLVCQLTGKQADWTQYDLKQKVGDQLKLNGTYAKMIKSPEGRRCWTLVYSEQANYHLDILPAIVDAGYRIILEKSFSADDTQDVNELALRITDREEDNYKTERNHQYWFKSNPFGYGRWFLQQATLSLTKAFSLNEAIEPLPVYKTEKLPLQRIVQILKRHRDMMFNGDDDKPISILITTLAASAYNKETNIIDGLINVVAKMPELIKEKYSNKHGKFIKWVCNPVNDEENFADKWVDYPKRQENFYKWLDQISADINSVTQKRGLNIIKESLERPFGKDVISKAFSQYGDNQLAKRESGLLKMASGSGVLAEVGTTVKKHNFHGK